MAIRASSIRWANALVVLVAVIAAVIAAGCAGSGGGGEANPQVSARGKQVFIDRCGNCHALKDAGTKVGVGPDLDAVKPDAGTVRDRVTNGGGAMPSFEGQLSPADIRAVAQYVSENAGH
jgi:mono/diheme cytochrome c family protein